MLEVTEQEPVVQSVRVVRMGNSKSITIKTQWGLGINDGDILTVKIVCDDGMERYVSQAVRTR